MAESGRLRTKVEFRRVFSEGRSLVNKVAVLYFLATGASRSRSGLVVSRKIGKAVVRNRVRRRLREVLRRHRASLREGWDLVLVARQRSRDAAWPEFEAGVLALLRQADLLKGPTEPAAREVLPAAQAGGTPAEEG